MTTPTATASYVEAPLTRSQLMLWTGQRLQPQEPLYNMALSYRLTGAFDPVVFSQAFQCVVQQSDALRSTFHQIDGVPKQRFHTDRPLPVECVDFSQEKNREEYLAQWLSERAQVCFDLEERLSDCVLIRMGENDHIWYFNQHHLITDAWSSSLVYKKVAEQYERLLSHQGIRKTEPDTNPHFLSYVEYEHARQDTKQAQRARRYWTQQLATAAPATTFYRPTPANRSSRTLRYPCVLGTARSQKLKALARSPNFVALSEDLARFQIIATVLFAWMHRVSNNQQLSLGTPSHNRGLASHKNTVGLFIEMYPLSITIDHEETFASLYAKVAKSSMNLLSHTAPGVSDFAHNRSFDVVLNYITAQFGEFVDLPMTSEWVHPNHGDRAHLLRMQVEEFDRTNDFRVSLDLNADAFTPEDALRTAEHFMQLMDALLDDPTQLVSQADMLTNQEQQSVAEGYATPALISSEVQTSVMDMFWQQVTENPQKTAVLATASDIASGEDVDPDEKDEALTYQALAERVSALTAKLQTDGITANARVGILMPRSIQSVTAILAVLNSGASYVPLDRTSPARRLSFQIENAAIECVLTTGDSLTFAEALSGTHTCIAVDDADSTPDSSTPVRPSIYASQTAYVLYTSGSTGQPKGVEVSHANLVNYIQWANAYYQSDGPLTWSLFSSLAFDLTVTSLFVPLCSGGSIVVFPEQDDAHDILIRDVASDPRIEIVKLTPAHLVLLQSMDLSLSSIRTLIVGGENFATELALSVHNYFGGRAKIYNEYGPTEGTVACAVHEFNPQLDTATYVPIGRAIDNAQLFVLNEHGHPQPPGTIGELYIAGAGVAKGYVNQSELTAERFVANTFIAVDGVQDRLYKTGDLVQAIDYAQASCSVLTCLGRADQQIKINGMRVEPGEIQAALNVHEEIESSAVVLFTEKTHNQQDAESFCVQCGISNRHPSAQLDDNSVCKICHVYLAEQAAADSYFRPQSELRELADQILASDLGKDGQPNCMMLLSGGKDSTYALCQVVDLGLRPLVFTLDNGFISEGAKDNMHRVVKHLGLELIVGTTPAMNEILADSLHRFSNVCNGCFKTIYTLSMKIAQERGIRHIFTGLSRGQIFETRVADLFRQRVFNTARIDQLIVEARKAYHRANDAVSQHMDVSHFEDDAIFETIDFVDFYRYVDVPLDEIFSYLNNRVPWVRPADTGRSTNCLVNEAGIYVHKQERGFHNYSLPYSWDVRLGHKERDAAREELDDNINVDNVKSMLQEIGYTPRAAKIGQQSRQLLTAYYVSANVLPIDALKAQLAAQLPNSMVPSHFVRMDALPLTRNGKLDHAALPNPDTARPQLESSYVAPTNPTESLLAQIWAQVFGLDAVGVHDNFFDLGGDSIINIQIVTQASQQGVVLSPQQVFDSPTIAELAELANASNNVGSDQSEVSGVVPLNPAQQRFFHQALDDYSSYVQHVLLNVDEPIDTLALSESLRQLLRHHDGLRSTFQSRDQSWQQTIQSSDEIRIDVSLVSLEQTNIEAIMATTQKSIQLESGPLLRAVVITGSESAGTTQATPTQQILLMAHHLVVDAVSWWIILEDLETIYRGLLRAQAVTLSPKTGSLQQWSSALEHYLKNEAPATLPLWTLPASPDWLSTDDIKLNALSSTRTIDCGLTRADTTQLLSEVPKRWRAQPQDLMLAAWTKTLLAWAGQKTIQVDMEAHGREAIQPGIDILRTVGWFTSVYPVSIEDQASTDALIRTTRDTLRKVPLGGVAYGAMRYPAEPLSETQFNDLEKPSTVLFNYLGQWRERTTSESLWSFARPLQASFGTDGQREYLFELNLWVYQGALQAQWTYSEQLQDRALMERLAKEFIENLRQLIAYCLDNEDTQLTPMDFPQANLSQSALDDLLDDFDDL